jgi:hypothetical protein
VTARVATSLRSLRPTRVALLVTAILGGLLVAEIAIAYDNIARAGDLWIDYLFYRDVGARWLADGSYYLPGQLSGDPYPVALMVDVLYPPHALLLFVPFAVLPPVAWWIVPLAIVGLTVWRWRPAPWTWPVMILLLMWPRANAAFLYGNTDMWMAAGIAAGLAWGWPALALTLKPIFLPLAFIGVRTRAWWVAAAVLVIVSLAMIPLWIQYVTVIRTVQVGLDYSLGSVPLLLVPIVAWFGRQRPVTPPSVTAA